MFNHRPSYTSPNSLARYERNNKRNTSRNERKNLLHSAIDACSLSMFLLPFPFMKTSVQFSCIHNMMCIFSHYHQFVYWHFIAIPVEYSLAIFMVVQISTANIQPTTNFNRKIYPGKCSDAKMWLSKRMQRFICETIGKQLTIATITWISNGTPQLQCMH